MSSGTSSPSKTLPAAMNPGLPAVFSGKNLPSTPDGLKHFHVGFGGLADARAAYLLMISKGCSSVVGIGCFLQPHGFWPVTFKPFRSSNMWNGIIQQTLIPFEDLETDTHMHTDVV